MRWAHVDDVKLHDHKEISTRSRRKSARRRRRPSYLTESYAFFNEADSKYSSKKQRKKSNASYGSLVISAWSLDHITGESRTLHLSKEARTRATNSFGKDGEVPYISPKKTKKKDTTYSSIKTEVNYVEHSDDQDMVPYNPPVTPRSIKADLNPRKRGRTARVNYTEDDKDDRQSLHSSEDEDKLSYTPAKTKRRSLKKAKKMNTTRMTKNASPHHQNLWDILDISKKAAVKEIKSFLPLHLRPGAEHLAEFLMFCHERQNMWSRRKRGMPKPWTKDTLLSSKHFTNMYRELDAGTVYFRRHVLRLKQLVAKGLLHGGNGFTTEVMWASICYRCLCRVETFEDLGGIPSISVWKDFRLGLVAKYEKGEKLFTAAYQVMGFRRYVETMEYLHNSGCEELYRLSKEVRVAGDEGLLEKCTKIIQLLPNVGNFYAWQITCDLMESGIIQGCKEATSDWVQLGPGAEHGLAYIFTDCSHSCSDNHLCRVIRDKQESVFDALGVEFIRFDDRSMSLKVLEHALCEFYKYTNCTANQSSAAAMRFYNGEGNGSAVPIDTSMCAGKYCATSINKGEYLRCDTCWRCFCQECSRVLGKVSWLCKDCRDLSEN
jgi:hypothetical protein